LTPRVGYQRLWVFGNSTLVDLTPNTDALAACGFQGTDSVTGAPICSNTLSNGRANAYDFINVNSFAEVRHARNRLVLGLTGRYEMVQVGLQGIVELTAPSSEGSGLDGARQWTFGWTSGVVF
jgi:hypothetical protein